MKKTLGGILLVLVVVGGYFWYQTSDADQPVLLCTVSDHKCAQYKNKEIIVAYGDVDGYCVSVNYGPRMCRPDFQIYKLNDLNVALIKACASSQFINGVYDPETYSCLESSNGKIRNWVFDPFTEKWEPANAK